MSALGDQAYHIAMVLWTKQATQSGKMVGAMLFAAGITSLLMPFGGVLADRFPRVRLLVVLDAFSGLCVLTLAALFFWLPEAHPFLVPALLIASFFRSAGMSLFHPVTSALVPDLVSGPALSRANSALQAAMQCSNVIGKSLGGLLFQLLGAPLLLLLDGLSFLLSAVSESFIREPMREEHHKTQQSLNVFHDLREGFRYTGRIRGFRVYMLEAACANFCLSSLFVCLPFFVEDVLRATQDRYGFILAAMGLGSIFGSLAAARFNTPGVTRGTVQILCMAGLNGCMLPLSLVRSTEAAMAVQFVAGACAGFHGIVLTTLVQQRTPREVRGRLFGLLSMIRVGLIPLGMAFFGVLIDHPSAGSARILFWTGTIGLAILVATLPSAGFRWFFTGDQNEIHFDKTTDNNPCDQEAVSNDEGMLAEIHPGGRSSR